MIFLIEFDVHNGTEASKLYVATHGIRTAPTDTPADQYFEPRLHSAGRIERSMFGNGDGLSSGTTGGRSEVGFGNISVVNGSSFGLDEYIDHWKDLAFRTVTIKSLPNVAHAYVLAVTRFVGAVEQLVSTNALDGYDIIVHDRLQDLDKPLLIDSYLGTTTAGGQGTADGGADQTDQIKQKVWGVVHNVGAVDVNHYDLVWQVSDGQVASIIIYDGGVALTPDSNVGSLASLFDAIIAPGHYVTCADLGLVRLGSPAQGAVTADVIEGVNAADRTAAQIAQRMLQWFNAMYGTSLALTTSEVTALDALNSAQCGLIVRDTESAFDAIMRVLSSIGAWMLPQSNSATMFDVGRLDLASGTAVASYDFDDAINGSPQRVESGDDGKGVPAWKVIVKYDSLAVVQTSSDLFGVVVENDPVRAQYLATEWRQASAENGDILVQWPNAPTITVETRLVSQVDAQAEANRLLDLYGTARDIWRITVPMSDIFADDPGVGEVVELTSRGGRMGLGPESGEGQLFRCIGRADDFDAVPLLTLTLYG